MRKFTLTLAFIVFALPALAGINNNLGGGGGGSVTFPITIPQGGTGQTGALSAINALAVNATDATSYAVGPNALANATASSINNTGFGYGPLSSLTTGGNISGFGAYACDSDTTGVNNDCFGWHAGHFTTSGNYNNYMGHDAGNANNTGSDNTAIGEGALYMNSDTLGGNTAVGSASNLNSTVGHRNATFGVYSGNKLTTGSNNLIIGSYVGSTTLTTGSQNILIGYNQQVDATASGVNNTLNIDNAIFGTGMSGSPTAPAGNIGIGIYNPSTTLEVGGVATIDTSLFIAGLVPPVGFNLAWNGQSESVASTIAASAIVYEQSDYTNEILASTSTAGSAIVSRYGLTNVQGAFNGASLSHSVGVKGESAIQFTGTGSLNYAIGTEGAITYSPSPATGVLNIGKAVQAYISGSSNASARINTYTGFTSDVASDFTGSIGTFIDYYSPNIGTNGGWTVGSEYSLKSDDPNKTLYNQGPINGYGLLSLGATLPVLGPTGIHLDIQPSSNTAYSATAPYNTAYLAINNTDTTSTDAVGIYLRNLTGGASGACVVSMLPVGSNSGNLRFNCRNAGTYVDQMALTGTGLGIFTTSPLQPLDVRGNITGNGLISNGTKFTTSGCSISSTTGGATAGKMTSGTSGTCTITITLPTSVNGWHCDASDETSGVHFNDTSNTTTSCVVSATTTSGDVITFAAMGF